jgi:hypothetical protein
MRIRTVLAVALAGHTGVALAAADWQINPRVSAQYETDDNNRLSINDEDAVEVQGFAVDALVEFEALTPTNALRIIPRGRVTIYPDEEQDERNMVALKVDWDYVGERSRAGINADISQRTVLGRYFPDSSFPDDGGFGEPDPGTGAGRSQEKTDELELRFRPRYSYAFTERTELLLRAGYTNVEFDEQVANDRQNFDDMDAAIGLGFRTSPSAMVSVFAGASHYSPEDGFDNDEHYINVDWSNNISDTSRIYLRGGASRVKIDDEDASWENSFNGGVGVKWTFEVTEVFAELNHYIDPSPAGQLVNRDQLRFELLRHFSERSTINLAARAIRDGKARADSTLEERRYFSGIAEYEWRFRREWSVFGGYEYTWREYEDDPSYAHSNRLFVGVRFQPNRSAGLGDGLKVR